MRERKQKHGHKQSEHQHGGKSMGKPNKRRRIAKRNRAQSIERIAQLDRLARERAALAAADPFSDMRPTLPSALFHESTPAEVPNAPPVVELSPVAASEPRWVTAADPPATGSSSWMRRGKLALLSFAMAAVAAGVVLVRACDHEAGPSPDDASALGACSDDATFCVALA
jgi:hypothetical protein